jgi:hypothetical protein
MSLYNPFALLNAPKQATASDSGKKKKKNRAKKAKVFDLGL